MDIYKDEDGTWAIDLQPWHHVPVRGIQSRKMALENAEAIYEALREYGSNAMDEG